MSTSAGLTRWYFGKAYDVLMLAASQKRTLTASELREAISLPPPDVAYKGMLDAILDMVDSKDAELNRPRLTALVIKKRDGMPVRKWVTSQVMIDEGISLQEADRKSLSMKFSGRLTYWEKYKDTVFQFWVSRIKE